MSECGKCGHAHRFTDVCGAVVAGVVCECSGRTLWEVFAAAAGDAVPATAEVWAVVREALGYEYGRQIGAGYSEPDLDGLANSVVAALKR